MFNIRRDAFNRLLVGSMGQVVGSTDKGLSHYWAKKRIRKIFPTLGEVEFETSWDGQIAMTPDHLPRIHELDNGLFTAIGYNGRGITTGTLFGKAFADLLAGMDKADLPLPVSPMKTVASAPVFKKLYQSAFVANQIIKSV